MWEEYIYRMQITEMMNAMMDAWHHAWHDKTSVILMNLNAWVFRRCGWLWMILNAIKRKPNAYILFLYLFVWQNTEKKLNNNKYITRQKHKHKMKIIFKWVHNIPSAWKEVEEEWISRTTGKPRANKHQVKWNCCWKGIFPSIQILPTTPWCQADDTSVSSVCIWEINNNNRNVHI